MKKIYIVTTGEYSDYQIVTCFSSKKKAEKYCAIKNTKWSQYYVEEYDVDSADVDDSIKVRYMYRAYFRVRDFLYSRVPKRLEVDYYGTTTRDAGSKVSCEFDTYTFEIVLDKKSESKAQKIADDMLAKFKAENI